MPECPVWDETGFSYFDGGKDRRRVHVKEYCMAVCGNCGKTGESYLYFHDNGVDFCSTSCKNAFIAKTRGNGSSSSSGGESSGDTIIVNKKGYFESEMQAQTERMAQDNEVKRQGMAEVQAIRFDGDAKSIMNSLGNLQVIAGGQGHDRESAKAIRQAAFEKFEFGIRALRGTGDTANAEYFEKKLKSMKRKAFFTNPLFAIVIFLLVLFGIIGILYLAGAYD